MQKQNVEQFKLKAFTQEGQRADKDTSPGAQVQTLNSVVDHRSVFNQIKTFDRIIEAICDSVASVSCLSIEYYDDLKTKLSLKMEPSRTQLRAANHLPIQTRGIVRFPAKIGGAECWAKISRSSKVWSRLPYSRPFLGRSPMWSLFLEEEAAYEWWHWRLFIPESLFNPNRPGFSCRGYWQCVSPCKSLNDHTSPHPRMEAPIKRVNRRIRAAWTVQGRQRGQCWPCLVQFCRENNPGDCNKYWGWRSHDT